MKTETKETRTVSPRRTFRDLMFKQELEALGYPCELEAGCKVTLPVGLIKRMEESSCEWTEPSATAQEARVIPKYIAPLNAMQSKRARLEAIYKTEKKVWCAGTRGSHDIPFSDGEFIMQLEVAGYPCAWYLDEPRELPASLVKSLVAAGNATTDADLVREARTGMYFAQTTGHVLKWREEQAEKREQAERDAQPKPPQLSPLAQEVLREMDAYYKSIA